MPRTSKGNKYIFLIVIVVLMVQIFSMNSYSVEQEE